MRSDVVYESKHDDRTKMSVDINDLGEVVISIASPTSPVPLYFVLDDKDLPLLHNEIRNMYVGYVEWFGGLLG